jgi:chemotaxis protein CheX
MTVMTEPSMHDVVALAQEVWASFLGPEEPLLEGAPIGESAPVISATVSVTGGWAGTISLHVPESLARDVTTSMLGGITDFEDADVSDAIGELVNVIGGQIKSLMPGPSVLSLPVVAHGRVIWPNESVEAVRADLAWRGHSIRVAVHVPVD